MRSLKRNKQKMYYALYEDSKPAYETDADGNIIYDIMPDGEKVPRITGTTTSGYSMPVEFEENISTSKGEASAAVFGVDTDYTCTISTCDMKCPISETSRIWKETEPVFNEDGTVNGDSADYTVVKVADSLNSVMYAVKQRTK